MSRLPHVLIALCVSLLTVTACATTGGPPPVSSDAPGTDTRLRGLVVPASDVTPLSLDERGLIRTLAGPNQLLAQLARIPGAYVAIRGPATSSQVRVRDFEIIDAGDGLRPLVGWVIVDQAGVQLEDSVTGTRLSLRGDALRDIKDEHGARVWVTGSVVGAQTLLVANWGILVPR